MSEKLRIAIVGYGIAGIAAALYLRRLGHDIVHFEQSAEPSFSGAGLLLQKTGLSILRELGLYETAIAHGAVISRLVGEARCGKPIMNIGYDEIGQGVHGLGIQRGALFRILRSADIGFADLRTSSPIVGVDAGRGILFERGGHETESFDLVIAADGAASPLRKALPASLVKCDRPYPWGALLCLLDDPDKRFAGQVRQYFSGTQHVSIWPVGTLGPGSTNRVNLSWRIPVAEQENMLAGNIGVWKRRISNLCPAIAPLLEQIHDRASLLTAGYRDVQLKQYYHGRVVLIGDAAHSMSPQLGQGASMALLDAQMLTRTLHRHCDVPTALAAFSSARHRHVATYQRISRAVTPIFQSDSRILAVLRDLAFQPLTRVPVFRHAMLRTLSGRQLGLFGLLPDTALR